MSAVANSSLLVKIDIYSLQSPVCNHEGVPVSEAVRNSSLTSD